MAWKITIGGVDKTTSVTQTRTPRISMPLNGRATMSFTCVNGYTPTKRQEVIAYAQDGTTKLFGGVIVQRRMDAYHERTLPAWTHCECGDYSTYADWCYQTKSYTVGPTLEAVLDDLVADKLTAYGISMHASQVTGPTLSPFDWTDKRVSDCLRELSDKTGYAYRIDADKKLRMFVPGTDAAPYGVTSGTPNVEDISWSDSTEAPANRVSVRCGPDGTDSVTQTWTQAGGATSWVTDIPAALGALAPGYVTVNGVFKTVGDGAMYEWEAATSTLTLGTDSTPTNGWSIVLTYVAQFPFLVTATTGASPAIEAIYRYPDVTGYAAAVNLADGLLDRVNQEPRTITMPSTQIGWLPGQSVSIVHANRDLNDADATITNVDIELITDSFWRYQLTAQETTAPQPDYVQEWRQMTGGGHGGGGGISGVAVMSDATPGMVDADGFAVFKTGITVGTSADNASYSTGTTIAFPRPDGHGIADTGDFGGLRLNANGTAQDLHLNNTAVNNGDFEVQARTIVTAQGWSDAGAGVANPKAEIVLRSTISQQDITLTADDVIALDAPSVTVSDTLTVGTATDFFAYDGTYATVADSSSTMVLSGSFSEAYKSTTTADDGPYYTFVRTRGTLASPSVVQSGDYLGAFYWRGQDGAVGKLAAALEVFVDGAPGSADMPGMMVFKTTPDGSDAPTERLRIDAAGLSTFAGGVKMGAATRLGGTITPTQLTGNTDNWNPTGLATANVIRINVDANRTITGIVAQPDGTLIWLFNTTAFDVTLAHDATSTAANRFYCYNAANHTLAQKASCWIRYDGTAGRWTVL